MVIAMTGGITTTITTANIIVTTSGATVVMKGAANGTDTASQG